MLPKYFAPRVVECNSEVVKAIPEFRFCTRGANFSLSCAHRLGTERSARQCGDPVHTTRRLMRDCLL